MPKFLDNIEFYDDDGELKKITDLEPEIREAAAEEKTQIEELGNNYLSDIQSKTEIGLSDIEELGNNYLSDIQSKTEIGLSDIEDAINMGLEDLNVAGIIGQITELQNFDNSHNNIKNGEGSGSVQQVDVEYTGLEIYDGENVGLRTGDIILGADATGVQSFAIGGLRYDCASYNYIKINEKYYDVISLSPVTLQYKKEGEDGYIAPIQEKNGTISVEGTSWEVSVNDKTVTLTDTQNNVSITSSLYAGREATSAEGNQSFAAGGSVHAYGDWSAAIGKDTKAYQGASISVGGGNIAGMPKETFDEIQDGQNPEITETNDEENRGWKDTYSFAFAAGSGNKAYGRNAFAVNGQNTVWMTDGSAFGNGNNVYSRNGLAGGQSNVLKYDAKNTFVIGRDNKEIHASSSIVSGDGNTARSARVLVSGQSNTVTGENSAAFGKNNAVTSWNCMSIGENNNITSTGSSFTAGNYNTITGYHNIAAGTNNNVSGQSNITVGARNFVSAGASLVGGTDNAVNGSRSLVVGGGSDANKNTTTSGATGVIVGGIKNTVSVVNAIVGGENNTAKSWNSLVIGVNNTTESSGQSIIGGIGNTNTGNHSLIAGQNNNNSGESSLLVGSNLINTTNSKTVVGKNNSDNASALFIVGNGNSSTDADRKNAFEALVDGRAKVYGEPTESDDVLRLNEFSVLTQIQVNLLF